MSKYEMLKVFDCQKMPKDERKSFFDYYDNGNDVYITYYNEEAAFSEGDALFVKWLFENGMTSDDEVVLIKHWW
jgi:hypothetical protein